MRIRSVKPEFFRDETLSDLENNHAQARPMLVFEGLWGVADSQGVFPWSSRVLKLDILPMVEFDISESLTLLEEAGMIRRFEAEGKEYGVVVNFRKHQRLSGKEATEGKRYPLPPNANKEASGKQQGSDGEAPGKHQGSNGEAGIVQEGKGKEGKGGGEISPPFFPTMREINPGVSIGAAEIDRLHALADKHGREAILAAYRAHQNAKPGQALRFFFEDLGKYLPAKPSPRKEPAYPSTAICPTCKEECGQAPGEPPGTYICRACSKDLPPGEWQVFRTDGNGKGAGAEPVEAADFDPASVW